MKLLNTLGLTAALLLAGCGAPGVTQAELADLRSDIRSKYELRGARVLELKLNVSNGVASGYIKYIEGGQEFSQVCTVTKYDNGDFHWRCAD